MNLKNIEDIIDNIVKQIFVESSSDENNIPEYFWLVTQLDESNANFAEQLASGVLNGIVGISDNKKIITNFFGMGRNVIVAMPGKEVIKYNNVVRIPYSDYNFLLKDNMHALYRIWSKEQNTTSGRRGMFENLMNYLAKTTKPWDVNKPLGYLMKNYYFDYWNISKDFAKSEIEINNISDLARFILNSAKDFHQEKASQLSIDDIITPLKDTFKTIASMYESEGEWIVKDNKLKIPQNSKLILGVQKTPDEFSETQIEIIKSKDKILSMVWNDAESMKEVRELYRIIEKYNLDKKYSIKWVNINKFRSMENKLDYI